MRGHQGSNSRPDRHLECPGEPRGIKCNAPNDLRKRPRLTIHLEAWSPEIRKVNEYATLLTLNSSSDNEEEACTLNKMIGARQSI